MWKKDNNIIAIELFAGAGGLALGLEKAGITSIAHIEIDKYCCETLHKNRPKWNVINDDISKVDFTEYTGKIDIVTGGFPCQAFSYAGKKGGFEDTRGTLFYEFARCVKEIKPIAFMAENVRGLLSHDDGKTLKTILEVLEELGYEVQYKVLNSVNYGIAQKRERIVIVGTKKGIKFTYPKESKKTISIKDVLIDVPKSEGQKYSEAKRKVLELVPPGGCWRDLPIEIQKEYMGKSYYSGGGRTGMARRLSWDEPSLTLTCSPSQKQTERCHPDETRPFTVREYARIQTFPDDWEFCGGIGNRYKQIGNAVPVDLAEKLGIELKKSILNYKQNNETKGGKNE
ncbi:MAG: DNA cytosine methyltransferase [Anaerovoracaceae bacterium]